MKRIGIFKLSSCDGCQLSFFELSEFLNNCDDLIEITYFIEGQDDNQFDKVKISFIEGSVSYDEEIEMLKKIRKNSDLVISIGSCAVSGGIQSARNFEDFKEVVKFVYGNINFISSLEKTRPVSDFIDIDYEIRGCPVNVKSIFDVLNSLILEKDPYIPEYSVCLECKKKSNPCQIIFGKPCLGPITSGGCGAICPTYNRGCYGCFGPVKEPQVETLKSVFESLGIDNKDFKEYLITSFNSYNQFLRKLL
ncbi:NADH-quinone oxidoreductase subunit B family protein [Persephonella sp.]